MKKLMVLGALSCAFSMAVSADQMTGFISDAHCGAKHDSATAANTKCVNGCIKGGAAPVLVSNGKVYTIDAESVDKVKSFAGQAVSVDGSVSGDSVKVASIEAAK